MTIKFAKIFAYLNLATFLVAGLLTGAAEHEILRESPHSASPARNKALELKGNVYYVTDRQWQVRETAKDVFLGTMCLNFLFVFYLKKHEPKGGK